jgi:hypothetical protein
MTKKKEPPFQSRLEQERKVKVIEKFSKGDYGVGGNPPTPEDFLPQAIIQEGLEDAYISKSNQ